MTLLAFASHDNAIAAQKGQISAAYVVEVAGVQMLKMSYDAAFTENTYQSAAAMKTKGMAGLFSDYKMDMTAMGAVSGNDADASEAGLTRNDSQAPKMNSLSLRTGPPAVAPYWFWINCGLMDGAKKLRALSF